MRFAPRFALVALVVVACAPLTADARWLDPGTGRFLSEDPLASDPDGLLPLCENPYGYARQDPVNRRDPTGWFSEGEIEVGSIIQSTIQNTARVNLFKLVGIVLAGTAIVGQTLGPPLPGEPPPNPYRFAIRVQLQQSPYGGGGVTLNTEGFSIEQATSIPVGRVQAELNNVWIAARSYLPWFPSSDGGAERDLRSAIIDVSKQLNRFPPGGISEFRRSFATSNFDYRKDYNYRVDVDNLSGWNLRN